MNPSSSSAAVLIPDQEGHGIRVLVSHDENIENTSSKLTRINTSPQSIGRKNSFFRRISVTTGKIYHSGYLLYSYQSYLLLNILSVGIRFYSQGESSLGRRMPDRQVY